MTRIKTLTLEYLFWNVIENIVRKDTVEAWWPKKKNFKTQKL